MYEDHELRSGTSLHETPSSHSHSSFDRTFWITIAFTLNYIVGSGVLSLPHAVAGAGIALGVLFLFLVYSVSLITAGWMVETTARATLLDETVDELDKEPLLGGSFSINSYKTPGAPYVAEVKNIKYEMSELVYKFYGRYPRIAFDVCIALFVLGALWLYVSVFADTLQTVVFPTSSDTGFHYKIWIPVFACIVVPLSMMDLSGQIGAQLALTAFAISIMIMMVFTTVGELFHEPQASAVVNSTVLYCNVSSSAPYIQKSVVTSSALFNFDGFGPLFTTALFSLLCQHGTPNLMQLIEDKKKVKKAFFTAFTLLLVIYSALSILTPLYFCQVDSLITANWQDYRDGPSVPWWAQAIRYLVQVFPVFTVSTAFPLNASALGNTLVSIAPTSWKDSLGETKLKILCRLVTIIPPFIAGTFDSKASEIVQYPGLLGFFIMMFVPALLQFKSYREVSQKFDTEIAKTPYWGIFSNYFVVGIIFLAASLGLPFAIYQTVK